MSVAEQVKRTFQCLPPGAVIVSADLHHLSDDSKRVDKAVSRLSKTQGLEKLRNGMYFKPFVSRYFGPQPPQAEAIIESLKKQYEAIIIPSGPLAAYELGFSGEAPEERVYDTDKRIGTFYLSNDVLRFRQVVGKKLSSVDAKLATLLNALEFFFTQHPNLNYLQTQFVRRLLSRHPYTQIKQGLSVRPSWLRERVESILKATDNVIYITGTSALNIPYQGQIGDWHQMGMLAHNKFHLAGKTYQSAPGLTAEELFDCSDFLNKHNIKLATTKCAKPARAIKDILYSNIIVKNRYPDFFMKDEYVLPLSDQELKACINELKPFANTRQSKLLEQWLVDNEIH